MVIPAPVRSVAVNASAVKLDANTVLYYSKSFEPQAGYLRDQLQQQTGLTLTLKQLSSNAIPVTGIVLLEDAAAINKLEMYTLKSGGNTVSLVAKDTRGIVNAIQTLLQLIPLAPQSSITVAAADITDYPQFSYRGMHLDVVRHFFPGSYIKNILTTSLFISSTHFTGT